MARWFRTNDGLTFHASKGGSPKALCGRDRPKAGPRSRTRPTKPDDDCCAICLLYLDEPDVLMEPTKF